jgi:hypothetical protein
MLSGKSPRTIASEKVADLFVALLMPALGSALSAEQRGVAQRDMAEMALALAAYRAAEGKYPPNLQLLVPRQLPKLPQDPWGTSAYRYQSTDDGFLLYSLGPNRQDDGGRTRWDEDAADADDIVLRMPKKPKPSE